MSAAPFAMSAGTEVRFVAHRAKAASRKLGTLSEAERNAALERMAGALEGAQDALFLANAEDMRAAEETPGDEALAPATLARLRLDEAKLREMVAQIRSVAALPDPLGRVLDAVELDDRGPEATDLSPAPRMACICTRSACRWVCWP